MKTNLIPKDIILFLLRAPESKPIKISKKNGIAGNVKGYKYITYSSEDPNVTKYREDLIDIINIL